jgi:hypothetical protein
VYESFASDYSRYPQASGAMNRAEALRWDEASAHGGAAAWSAYLRLHHQSARADQARANLDDASWNEALAVGTWFALSRYLSSHPNGAHVAEANMELELVVWEGCVAEDTVAAYQRYIQIFPAGSHSSEATKRHDDRWYSRTERVDSVYGYRGYLEAFPEGLHREEVLARLEQITFDKVQVSVVLGSSWVADRRSSRAQLAQLAQLWIVPELEGLGFEVVGSVGSYDGAGTTEPRTLVPLKPYIGHVVLWVDDRQGALFEPIGHETIMTGTLFLFAETAVPELARYSAYGGTPDKVYSATAAGLYLAAAEDLASDARTQTRRLHRWKRDSP